MLRFIVLLAAVLHAPALSAQSAFKPVIPRVWDEAALADWATPVAGLNVRPTHLSAKDYYSLTVDNRRTYPVYYPGREPEGYWEMLQHVAPKPLIEPDKLKSRADWVEAGSRVFTEFDDLHLRTVDPKIVATARTRATFEAMGAEPLADGTVYGLRWVPTERGVAISVQNCAGCHLLYLPDDTPVPGASSTDLFRGLLRVARGTGRCPERAVIGRT